MLVGALVPFHDTGGDPDTVRDYAQALEAVGAFAERAMPGRTIHDTPEKVW